MKFKVTATIPVELEIDCQSKEEALNTATTILQEQRDDGDYASIVADCIESALVSGSITMTAVDDHVHNITTLCIRMPHGKRGLPKRKPDSTKNMVL